jgi:N-acetylglucosamine kinase-like BadF-type ATPase
MKTSQPVHTNSLPKPGYYLGIDGGGSKTLAVIVDAQGRVIGRGQAGSSNPTGVGLPVAIANIYTAVVMAHKRLGPRVSFHKAWLGIAGIDRQSDQQVFETHVQSLASTVYVTNDAELALSALPATIGVVLIAGTGSISLGRNAQGQTTRSGGWGHVIGDEGSGYALGQQALQAAVRAADGRGPQTLLLESIMQQWQIQQAEDIIGEVYNNDKDDKAKIARLSSCVFAAEEHGDVIAHEIVQNNLDELVLVVRTVGAKLGFSAQQPLPLALSGGLLLNEIQFQSRFVEQLRQQQSIDKIVHVKQPALSAARSVIHATDFKDWFRI